MRKATVWWSKSFSWSRMYFKVHAYFPSRRNPKLYEGDYVSLVHRSDGKYACTLKCINDKEKDFDHHTLAFRIYLELISALEIIR